MLRKGLNKSQIAPLLFDTVVTAMTVWKAFNIRRRNGGPNSRLIQTFLREGKSHVQLCLLTVDVHDNIFRCFLLYLDIDRKFGILVLFHASNRLIVFF